MLGSLLRQREQQYAAIRDEKGTWRILDTWHSSLETKDPDEEIPDDSPAVTVLTEGGFIALVKEAVRLGIIKNATAGGIAMENVDEEKIEELKKEIEVLKTKPIEEKHSESFLLKRHAMDSILKVVGLDSINEIK